MSDCSDSKKRRSLHIGGENALCGIKGIKLRFFLQIECIMAAGSADCIGKPELLGHRNAGVGERRISRCTAEGVRRCLAAISTSVETASVSVKEVPSWSGFLRYASSGAA